MAPFTSKNVRKACMVPTAAALDLPTVVVAGTEAGLVSRHFETSIASVCPENSQEGHALHPCSTSAGCGKMKAGTIFLIGENV